MDELLAGNKRYVEAFSHGDLPLKPAKGTLVITCMDPRVDPLKIFDGEIGDTFVLRSVGGRVTDAIAVQVGLLDALLTSTPDIDLPDIVVMHHTRCGTAGFANPELRAAAAKRAGIAPEDVDAYIVSDPFVTVAEDVERIRSFVPPGHRIEGRVYDMDTGEAISV